MGYIEWLFGGFIDSIGAIIHDLLIRQLGFKIVLILSDCNDIVIWNC